MTDVLLKHNIDYVKYIILIGYLINEREHIASKVKTFLGVLLKESDMENDSLYVVRHTKGYLQDIDLSRLKVNLGHILDYYYATSNVNMFFPDIKVYDDIVVTDNMFRMYLNILPEEKDREKIRPYIEFLYYSRLVLDNKLKMEDLLNFVSKTSESRCGFESYNLLEGKTLEEIKENGILEVNLRLNEAITDLIISKLNKDSTILSGPNYMGFYHKLIYGFTNL